MHYRIEANTSYPPDSCINFLENLRIYYCYLNGVTREETVTPQFLPVAMVDALDGL